MIGKIERIQAFAEVARRENFSAAARALNLSPPGITRLVAELERDLSVQLLVRTTRKVALTTAGRLYLDKVEDVLKNLRDADELVRAEQNQLAGHLRISAPLSFGQRYLATAVNRFRILHDKINITLTLDDSLADLLSDEFDMALRIAGPPKDQSAIWRKMSLMPRVLVAAPSYLSRRGTPHTPGDLKAHNCLGYAHAGEQPSWVLSKTRKTETVPPQAFCFSCNNGDLLADLAALGEGIALLPGFIVDDSINGGTLVEIMSDWAAPEIWLSAVYPPFEKLPAKVAVFTQFIEDAMADRGQVDLSTSPHKS
ncbi:LysR family transcriptional regulator [Aestuariivirga litoralis]|uniref:LysR family transcriptional regulator n=1 Tax=Aestuariivirga litoralis TaxID=2650924 RepID=UPI0018C7A7F7|nr:LysR family transcriptional regulator [Aestuariivirga litoralis]MBG1233071.1 LysR family transcriptional regulator [Aestuariivirga litoralis]